MYRGSAGFVGAATVPYYGGGLRLFPFARMTPSGMHLRITRRIRPLEGVSRIPSIFAGSFRDRTTDTSKCLDFVGNRFAIELYESSDCACGTDAGKEGSSETEKGFPVQHSGESLGRCTRVEFTVSSSEVADDETMPPPMRFMTLMPPRLVEEPIDVDP